MGILRGSKTYFYTWKSNKLASEDAVQAFIAEHEWYTRICANTFIKRCEVREVTGKAGER